MHSPHTFRTRFNNIFSGSLGLCVRDGIGFTSASLRAGGATDLYLMGTGIDIIRWKLRHAGQRSVDHYIQEAGAALAGASLNGSARIRVSALSSATSALFSFFIDTNLLRSPSEFWKHAPRRRSASVPAPVRRHDFLQQQQNVSAERF